jgi:2-C-methyl-D-erythritol 4-phosphate cytidylyltransferase
MSTHAIVVAAGLGIRMGAAAPKALLPLAGLPMVAWSLNALRAAELDGVIVVAPPGHEDEMRRAVGDDMTIISGGSTRSRSVAAGLAALPRDASRVLVHDAARPLVTATLVEMLLGALDGVDGAIAASPLSDTLKRQDDESEIAGTVDREGLWRAETPQAFHLPALAAAFAAADDAALDQATDCAWLVERNGGRVRLVNSGAPNLKVTTPSDMLVAEALLTRRM